MTTPSKRSMERAVVLVKAGGIDTFPDPAEAIRRIALAFDKLIDETCEVVKELKVNDGLVDREWQMGNNNAFSCRSKCDKHGFCAFHVFS